MRFLVIILILFCLAGCKRSEEGTAEEAGTKQDLSAQGEGDISPEECDFRRTRWGMSRQQVRKNEKGRVTEEDEEVLSYEGSSVANLDCNIIYVFTNDRLSRALYVFTEEYMNDNSHISDFDRVKEMLTKKYGTPGKDQKIWLDDLFKNNPDDWGTAISMGHLAYVAAWETPKTEITLLLGGENFEINHFLEYQSKELEGLQEDVKERRVLEDL